MQEGKCKASDSAMAYIFCNRKSVEDMYGDDEGVLKQPFDITR